MKIMHPRLMGLLLLITAPALAEQVEIVTYYPKPELTAEPEPPKPYRMLVGISSPGADVFVDVYAALKLHRFNIARSQLSIVQWRLSDWNDMMGTSDNPSGVAGTGPPAAWMSPSPSSGPPLWYPRTLIYLWQEPGWLGHPAGHWIWITVPSMENGMVWSKIMGADSIAGLTAMLDVEVTW